MPRAARWSGRSRVMSSPFRRTVPAIAGTIPMIAFISVDLPTPFLPMVATISPAGSAAPPPAGSLRSHTRREGRRCRGVAGSLLPQIDPPHFVIRLDFLQRPVGEDATVVQHRHPARDVAGQPHVVLPREGSGALP